MIPVRISIRGRFLCLRCWRFAKNSETLCTHHRMVISRRLDEWYKRDLNVRTLSRRGTEAIGRRMLSPLALAGTAISIFSEGDN